MFRVFWSGSGTGIHHGIANNGDDDNGYQGFSDPKHQTGNLRPIVGCVNKGYPMTVKWGGSGVCEPVEFFPCVAAAGRFVILPEVQPTTPADTPGFPRPIQGRSGTVGVTSKDPAWFLVLFGLVFAIVGGGVLGVSLGWIPSDESSFHGGRWLVGCVGTVFLGAGLGVVGMGLRTPLRKRVLARNRRLFPNQPALWDYPWNPQGGTQNRLAKFVQSLLAALGITLFLVPFNWWAFFSGDDTWMVKIIVGVFDLILVACWWGMFHTLVWALKYGPARLTWDAFPVRRDAVQLRWEPGRGLHTWDTGVFTLRCVRERVERTGRKNGNETRQLHECLWEEERRIDGRSAVFGGRELGLAFTLPAGVPGTCLSAEDPVYWELEVKIARPGVDFLHRYLVPIYG